MTAIELKEAALYFLRFERKMTHICTEFGQYNADVVGSTASRLIEIETKVNLGDLRNDFKNKIYKHKTYTTADLEYQKQDLPNYFYFMVPPELADEASLLCEANNKNYGVISYAGNNCEYWNQRWKVVRRGKRIHSDKPSEKVLSRMAARMANEIVTAHMLKHRVHELKATMVSELRSRFDNPTKEEIFEEDT